jgi:hypothetical protein
MKLVKRISLTIAMILVFGGFGFIILRYRLIEAFATRLEPADAIRFVFFLFLAYHSSIVLHELGHLASGLATGYRFLSFRIFSIAVERQRDGKLRCKRRPVSGMLGQCLMIPREAKKLSVFWYNFGGVMFNLVQIGIAWMGYTRSVTMDGKLWWFSMIMMGVLFVIFNWLPFPYSHNDGNNYREIKRDPLSMDAFVYTLRLSREIADDARLSELKLEMAFDRLSYDKPIQSWVKSLHVMKALYEFRFTDFLAMTDEAEVYFEDRKDPRANGMKIIFYLARLIRNGSSAVKTKDAVTTKLLKLLKKDPLVQLIAYYEALLTNDPKKERMHARFRMACLKSPFQGEAVDIQNLASLLEESVSNSLTLCQEPSKQVEIPL